MNLPTPPRRLAAATIVAVTAIVAGGFVTRGAESARAGSQAHTRDGRAAPNTEPVVAWSTPTDGWVGGIVADERDVAVVAGNRHVRVLDAATGNERWTVDVAGVENQPPALGRDVVVAATENGFAVLGRDDGGLRWRLEGAGAPGLVTIADHTLVLATTAGTLAAWPEPEAGRANVGAAAAPRWNGQVPGRIAAAPAVEGDRVFVSASESMGATLRALDAATGALRWERRFAGPVTAPAARGDLVVVGDSAGHALAALDAATGSTRWTAPVPSGFESGQRPLIVATERGPLVVAADHFAHVVAVDGRSGTTRWTATTAHPDDVITGGAPVAAGPVVLVASEVAGLSRLRLADGTLLRGAEPAGMVAGLSVAGRWAVIGLRLTTPGRVEAWAASPDRP